VRQTISSNGIRSDQDIPCFTGKKKNAAAETCIGSLAAVKASTQYRKSWMAGKEVTA
jgi:hypothetical protein